MVDYLDKPGENQLPQWLQALVYHLAPVGRGLYQGFRQSTIPTEEQAQAHTFAVKNVEALTKAGASREAIREAAKEAEATGFDPAAIMFLGGVGGAGKGLSSFFYRKQAQDIVAKSMGHGTWDKYLNYMFGNPGETAKLAVDRKIASMQKQDERINSLLPSKTIDVEARYKSGNEIREYTGNLKTPLERYRAGVPLNAEEKKVIEQHYGIPFDRLEEGKAYTQQEKYPWLMGLGGGTIAADEFGKGTRAEPGVGLASDSDWRVEYLNRDGKRIERHYLSDDFVNRSRDADEVNAEIQRRMDAIAGERSYFLSPEDRKRLGMGKDKLGTFFDIIVPEVPTSSISGLAGRV